VIEGIDGAGKTTQAAMLSQHFGQLGFPVLMSKEPTIRKWGRTLRETAAAGRLTREKERELFRADREEHVAEVIRPALSEGHVVILDRYYFSTAAYQSESDEEVREILAANEAFAPMPDCALVLDVAPAEGLRRIMARGDSPNSFESEGQLARAGEVFRSLGDSSIHVIDGCARIGAIHRQVVKLAKQSAVAKLTGVPAEVAEPVREALAIA